MPLNDKPREDSMQKVATGEMLRLSATARENSPNGQEAGSQINMFDNTAVISLFHLHTFTPSVLTSCYGWILVHRSIQVEQW